MSSLEVPGYFKGTDIAAFVVAVVLVLPVNFNLYLNDSEWLCCHLVPLHSIAKTF